MSTKMKDMRNFLNGLSDEELQVLEGIMNERTISVEKDERLSNDEEAIKRRLKEILKKLGCPVNIKGYYYIIEATYVIVQQQSVYDAQMTKVVYPDTAEKVNSTASRVERAIRHAIERMFYLGNIEELQEMFGYSYSDKKGKPTNGEFLCLLAERIADEMK